MRIVVKPVKCGDCSIIYGEPECLLVDCGSSNSDGYFNSSGFSYNTIHNEIYERLISHILISHFHKDHFNGTLQIPDTYKLDTAYLPYSVIDGEIPFLKGIGRLLAVASSRSWGFQLSKNIIELFIKLDKIANKIRFLKKGDFIPFNGEKIRILWPETVKAGFDYGSLPVKLINKKMQGKDNAKLISSSDMSEYETGYEATTSLMNIERELENDFNAITAWKGTELVEIMQVFISSLDTYLSDLHNTEHDTNKEIDIRFAPVIAMYEILAEYRKVFRDKASNEELQFIKYFSRQQYHSLVTSMNAISLICDYGDKFIFLADAPTDIVDNISPDFNERYTFVKIQHHGTKRYFTNKTPVGYYNIISNGGYQRRKISEEFIKNIGTNKILCTNAHNNPADYCSYYLKKGECSPMCVKIQKEHPLTV